MSTLGQLALEVARKVGDETVSESYTEAEVKQAIGESYYFYVLKLIEIGQGYFETTDTLDIVSGTETISLSTLSPTFYKISQLWRKVSGGYVPLQYNEKRYVVNNTIGVGSGPSYIPTYRKRGNNIILEPTPQFSEIDALKLDYVYIPIFPTGTSNDGFAFDEDFPTIYEVNVKLRAAIKLLESKDAMGGVSDINTFRAELAEFDDVFLRSRSMNEEPDSVQYSGEDYTDL